MTESTAVQIAQLRGRVASSPAFLKQATVMSSLPWAESHVFIQYPDTGKFVPFSLMGSQYAFPFLRDIYHQFHKRARHVHVVTMKPVQMAVTTVAINITFYFVCGFHQNALYTLPVEGGQIGQFTHNRLDPVIENSPYLAAQFNDISNVGLKKAGDNSIYLRGMQSEAKLEEMPIGFAVRDELDFMNLEVADKAHDRLQGNPFDWKLDLSHPTVPGEGVDHLYSISSRGEWHWTCPHCETVQPVTWEDNVDVERAQFVCKACKQDVDKADFLGLKGGTIRNPLAFYVHAEEDNPVRGFHFNQLLSPLRPLEQQIRQWHDAQGHPARLRRFYNGVLGLPYAERGEKLTREGVRELMQGRPTMQSSGTGGAMGIDVGAGLHGWVQVGDDCVKVFHVGTWSDIDYYIEQFKPEIMVIDAEPEHHQARDFGTYWTARGLKSYVCVRTAGRSDNKAIEYAVTTPGKEAAGTVTANFTEQFDTFYATLRGYNLPSDLPDDAIDHLCAPVRVQRETSHGMQGTWKKGENHFADAAMYAMEGLEILAKRAGLTDVKPGSITKVSTFRKHEGIKRMHR